MAKRVNVSMPIPGGMYSAGDPALIPDGRSRRLRNVRLRPGPRIEARPAAAYDNIMNPMGLFSWDDQSGQTSRLLCLDTSKALSIKNPTGETWGSIGAGTLGTRLTDVTNLNGVAYYMLDDGSGKPTNANSYDGAAVSSTPFDSVIASRTVTAFNERLFLAYPRATVTPALGFTGGTSAIYDWATSADWVYTNMTASNIVSGSTTVCRLFPTSTAAGCLVLYNHLVSAGRFAGFKSIAASDKGTPLVWRSDLRPVDRTYRVPMKLELVIVQTIQRSTAYVVGDVLTSALGGIYYRCTVAGTSAAGAVVLTTVLGASTVDGTATFLAEGSDVISATEFNLPNLTDTRGDWVTRTTAGTAPWSARGYYVTLRLNLFNAGTPLLTVLSPVDISLRDGIADGTASKKNYGQQLTQGDYFYPFVNTETATTATIDLEEEIWTEIGKPRTIRASNTQKLKEAPGLPTAACALTGRKLTFKRNAFWVFQGSTDPDFPIIRERVVHSVGCVGPRAVDVFEDTAYFIGDNGVYRWNSGMGDKPEELCGEGMYEEMTSKSSSTWVESQTYKQAILKIDKANKEVWVYLQKGILYVYNLASKSWATHDIAGGASSSLTIPRGKEIADMAYHRVTGLMYFAIGGFGLVRFDPANGGFDVYDNIGTNAPAYPEVWPKVVELHVEGRVDALLEELGVKHNITNVSGISIAVDWSSNGGNTFTATTTDLLAVAVGWTRVPVTLYQSAPSMQLKIYGAGGIAGPDSFRISALDMWLQIHSGEWPQIIPTVTGSTL